MTEPREFSKRHGFKQRPSKVIRQGCPQALRDFVLMHVSNQARGGSGIHRARDLVSHTLKYIPNPSNQAVDQIWREIVQAVYSCDWFLIYDLIEELYRSTWALGDNRLRFVREVNEFFYDHNIGWQLKTVPIENTDIETPEIVVRGDEAFERTVASALDVLGSSKKKSAKHELAEAIHGLSRRPFPDLTGAVSHAIAPLECVSAEVCGETGETLGQIVKRHPARFPPPLDEAISKLYGFSSTRGRHVIEGRSPSFKEAEIVVSIAAAVSAFITD